MSAVVTTLVWALVALVGLVLAYRVALAFAERPTEIARRVQRVEAAIVGDDARLAQAEKHAEAAAWAVKETGKVFAALEERVLVVEQRTDPQLARGRAR